MSEDRVIVLTGSSSGLGAALLKHFAKKGFGVVMNYVVDSAAEKVYQELLQITDESKIMKYKADVVNRQQVSAMFDEIVDKFGRVDILINFAGINRDAPFVELTLRRGKS